MRRLTVIFVLLLLFVFAPAALRAQNTRPLRVMLYPYIPDVNNDGFATLTSRLEEEFESLYPQIDLTVEMNVANNTYDTSLLDKYYTDPNGPQVIELDLMMLDYITRNNYILPASYYNPDSFSATIKASVYNDNLWAVPTRACSLFLFGFNPEIATATTSPELVNILQQLDPYNEVRNLVGSFYGTNTLSIYYADFYIGAYGPDSIYGPGPFYTPPNPSVVYDMAQLFEDCTFNGVNLCLTNFYADESIAPTEFAEGKALSYIGFSESLYYIRKTAPSSYTTYITAAPLGRSLVPMIYSDGLTMNAINCDSQCQADTASFAKYYLSNYTQLWITLGEQAPSNTIPLYVLPAQPSFYDLPQIAADPYFDEYLPAVIKGYAFPTTNYTDAREPLFTDVCQMLDFMMPGEPCSASGTEGK